MVPLFILIFGLAIGSFIGAYSYRIPKNIKIAKGRSFCPKCKKQILWYDNIPVISYLILKGRCRHCKKKISLRYPLIEFSTALLFLLIFMNLNRIFTNLPWFSSIPSLILTSYFLLLTAILIAVFVIDLEHQLIPDEPLFLGLLATSLLLLFYSGALFTYLLGGVSSALFLLFLHLLTRGRGMGLGDVKLALFVGTIFGPKNSLVWIFTSFVVGGIFAFFLLVFNKKGLKDKIAFGPFLVLSFFITIFFARYLTSFIIPF